MKALKIDRRKERRTQSVLPLKISQPGLDVITETRNISCSGVYCRVDQPVPLMSKIEITLLLPLYTGNKVVSKKIKCSGVVVRSEPEIIQEADKAYQNIAIFFNDLSNKDRENIAQYVLQSFNKI